MKKLYIFLTAILMWAGFGHEASAQCSGGTNSGSITMTSTFQTIACVQGGEYYTFSATGGNQYIFTFCQGGGSAGWDTQITILDNSGTYANGYNDDNCGLQSEVTWTAPSTGTFRVLINQYSCATNSTCGTLAYREAGSLGPGATCGNPYVIPSLPFSQAGMTTCGYGDDFSSSDACLSSYMGGDDFVFTYTASGAQTINVSLTNTGTYVGVFVLDGCPSSIGTNCIAAGGSSTGCSGGGASNTSSSGNPSADFSLPSAGTYYIVVSTWPSPQCTPFDISVTTVSGGGGGPGPAGCYSITNPAYNPDPYNSGTLLSFPDDEFSGTVPLPFSFCYFGTYYNSIVVSSNAYISFNSACAGQYSPYDTDPIPASLDPETANSILGPWSDIDPSVTGSIRYRTYGTAPNRRFVVSYQNVAMFSSSCHPLEPTYTGQITLYETSNIIDNYVQNYDYCTAWNNGEGVLGLTDASNTVAVPVPGYNNTQFDLTNYAVRYTPNCCNILPLNFAYVNGEKSGKVNVISWGTSTEIGTDKFIVERSKDGSEFKSIGEVKASGNSPVAKDYAFTDEHPSNGKNYYRIVQVSKDGNQANSEVVEIFSDFAGFAITNHYRDGQELHIVVETAEAVSAIVEILDVTGRVVMSDAIELQSGETRAELDVNGLTPGMYFYRITTAGGQSELVKFIR